MKFLRVWSSGRIGGINVVYERIWIHRDFIASPMVEMQFQIDRSEVNYIALNYYIFFPISWFMPLAIRYFCPWLLDNLIFNYLK